jgi:hypothetical protein
MKSIIRSILIAVFLWAVSPLSTAQTTTTPLLKLQEEGFTLRYEESEADIARQASKEIITRFKPKPLGNVRKQFDVMKSRREEILAFIAAELGMEKPGEQMTAVFDKFSLLMPSLLNSLNDAREFRIWNRERLKSMLASGEKIPGFSYSVKTGEIFFNVQSSDPSIPPFTGPLPLVVKRTGTDPMVQIAEQLNTYEQIMREFQGAGVLCHEVAEIGMSADMGMTSPFRRWLVEGAANHIAMKTLDRFLGKEIAQDFASAFDTRIYEARKKQIDLVGWRAIEWDKITPSNLDTDLTQAYYGFATKAFEEHIVKSGPDAVPALFKGIAATGDKSDAEIYAVLKTITGKDVRQALEAEYPPAAGPFRGFAARFLKVHPLKRKVDGSWEIMDEADTITLSIDRSRGFRMFLDYGSLGQRQKSCSIPAIFPN